MTIYTHVMSGNLFIGQDSLLRYCILYRGLMRPLLHAFSGDCTFILPSMVKYRENENKYYTVQICSGITLGRVLDGVFYAHRFWKLIYLYLFTGLFHADFSSIVK